MQLTLGFYLLGVGVGLVPQDEWFEQPGVWESLLYLWIFRGVDDLALPVHHPVHWNSRDDIGLDELKAIHILSRGSGKLGLICRRVKGLLPVHPLKG